MTYFDRNQIRRITMRMDPPLLQQLHLSSEYPLSPEHDCIDPITSHGHNSPFTNGREGLGSSSLLSLPQSNSVKCVPSQHASESSYAGTSTNLPTTSSSTGASYCSNSIALSFPQSTSLYSQTGTSSALPDPYSATSQVFGAPYNYNSNSFPPLGAISTPRAQLSPSTGGISGPGILHSTKAPHMGLSSSNSIGRVSRDTYSTSTPGINRHLSSGAHFDMNRSFPDLPPILAQRATMNFPSYQPHPRNVSESPPFEEQQTFVQLKSEDGQSIKPSIICKIEKGFFLSTDNCWTCYRRNYFSVACRYTLSHHPYGRSIFLERSKSNKYEQVQAMSMCLSAVVDGTAGKTVDLVQHTPKRDRGPQTSVQKTKIMPMLEDRPNAPQDLSSYSIHHPFNISHNPQLPHPNFPLQQAADTNNDHSDDGSAFPGHATLPHASVHTFERIQFKSATANNGKRRAQQQYYHLIVELWADVRPNSNSKPEWVKVAQKLSSQVVVRGRSPSHYSNEGPNSVGRTPGSCSSSTLGGPSSGSPPGGHWTPSIPQSASSYQQPPLTRFSTGGASSGLPYNLLSQNHSHHHHTDHINPGHASLLHIHDNSHVEPIKNLASTNGNTTSSYHYIPGPLFESGLASPSAKAMVKSESRHGGHQDDCRMTTDSRGIYQYGVAPDPAAY